MLNDLRSDYDELLSKKTVLLVDKKKQRGENKALLKEIKAHIEARDMIAKVIKITQYKTKRNIEKTVTLAIRSVYDRPYTFHLDIQQKRNRVEYFPYIKEGKYIRDPKDDMGGGIMDIIALAFRAVLQALEVPRSRSTLFLDQPFPNCGSLTPRAFAMAKELSIQLPIQIIIIAVSFEDELIMIADRAWRVTHNGIKSTVRRMLKRR